MKQLLFSVTKDQFVWQFFRASGPGGQKRNKTSSACRCIHEPSGAIGQATESRKQSENRRDAFLKCVNGPEFTFWVRAKAANIEKQLNIAMNPENIKIEYFEPEDGDGKR